MIKKIFLVLLISILMLSISGCTDEVVEETPANTDNDITTDVMVDTISDDSTSQELIPSESLPDNYEFLGVRDLSVEAVEKEYVSVTGMIGASEGLYMYMDSTDVYIDVIEMEDMTSAEGFIDEYRSGFKSLSVGEGRFTDVTFNDHSAVRILNYVTDDTSNVKRYTYIWNNGNFVFVVGGATDDYAVLSELAEATGY